MTSDEKVKRNDCGTSWPSSAERDQEVADILAEIRSHLHTASVTTGVQQDLAHAVAVHVAAPYALTLFYEIERLDAELAKEQG